MDVAKEIKALWDAFNDLSIKVSKFYDDRHAESTQGITDSEEAICDLDESMTQRMTDIEEALCELSSGGEE